MLEEFGISESDLQSLLMGCQDNRQVQEVFMGIQVITLLFFSALWFYALRFGCKDKFFDVAFLNSGDVILTISLFLYYISWQYRWTARRSC